MVDINEKYTFKEFKKYFYKSYKILINKLINTIFGENQQTHYMAIKMIKKLIIKLFPKLPGYVNNI